MRAATALLLLCLSLCTKPTKAQTDTIRSPFVPEPITILDWSARSLDPMDTIVVIPWSWCWLSICCGGVLTNYHGPVISVGYTYDGARNFLEFGGGYYFSGPELLLTEETRTDFHGRWDLGVNALFNTFYRSIFEGQVRVPFLRAGPTIGMDLWNGQSRPYVKGTLALLGPLARVNIGAGYKVALSDADIPALREGFSFDLVVYLLTR